MMHSRGTPQNCTQSGGQLTANNDLVAPQYAEVTQFFPAIQVALPRPKGRSGSAGSLGGLMTMT